jgi:uncharacterized lipoprotein YmbA
MIMLKTIQARPSVLALCMTLIFLAGCAVITAKSSRFYVLSPMAGAETGKQIAHAETSNVSIGIRPISLPKYLRKSQIVTRTGSNEVQMAEFDRWAGKIEEDIGRVIAENLAHMLSTDKVLSYPAISAVDTDYTIEMNISSFEGRLGESVELVARWAVFDKQGNNITSITSTRLQEQVQGLGYTDMVAAQSRALASLSRELADAIMQLPGK